MSDPDHRDRSRSEPPLTIDRQSAGPSRGPAPVTLIVSVILLAVVAGGVFLMYRGGPRGAGEAPQPLGAPLSDVRTAAPAQPPSPDAGAGLTISKDDPNAVAAPPTLAPAPEPPLPESAPAPTPAQSPVPAPAPVPAAQGSAAAPPPSAVTKSQLQKVPPAAAPAASTHADDKADAIGQLLAPAAKPKPKPKAAPAPTEVQPSKAPKAPAAEKPAEGAAVVQIGAFSSEHLADREWSKAAALAPGAMAGKGKRVVPVTKDGATLYRTSITGFATRAQAQALCDRLKAQGETCFVH